MKRYEKSNRESLIEADRIITTVKLNKKIPTLYHEPLHNIKFKEMIDFKQDNSKSHCKVIANSYYQKLPDNPNYFDISCYNVKRYVYKIMQ